MAFPDDWSNYKEITIDADLVPADGEYVFNVSLKDDADVMAGCNADGSDIRFTAADGTTQLDFGLIPRGNFVNYTGAYTWFHGPYAVFHGTGDGATNNRSFYAYVTHNGEWAISQYDHDDDAWSHALLKAGAIDDHNNPSVIVRSDGKLLCVYCAHNGTEIYRRVSSAAESIASFAAESAISPDGTLAAGSGYTYPTLLKFTSEGSGKRIYMVYRTRTPNSWKYSYSDDDGETWSAGAALWEEASSVPYMQAVSNGVDRMDFIASDGHADEAGTAFVHFYYDGTWRSTDGTSAGSPGFIESDFNSSSQVYTSNERWHSDIILNGSNPWILYYRFASAGTDQDLYLARWSGSAWSSAKIMDEGGGVEPTNNTHYPGVARFDPDDPTVFYAAVQVSGVYEIQKWETSDGGDTWSKTEDITSGSTLDNFRPYPVRNGGTTKARLMWMGNGRYDDFDDLQIGIRCWPPTSHAAAHALVKANLTGATDTTIRVYYGFAGATDGQNKAGVASGYAMFTPMAVANDGNVSLASDWSTNGIDGTITGNLLTGYTGELPSLTFKKFGDNDYVGYGTQFNFANEDEVSVLSLLYWDESAGTANEHVVFGAWDGATKANILFRIEPSDNKIEYFAGIASNTQVGGTVNVTLTPQAFQLVYAHYDNDAASDQNIAGRVNTTEAFFTSTNANTFDADATVSAAIGRQSQSSATDIFYGEVAFLAVKLGVLSKNYTDVLANSITTQSTFRAFGTEQNTGSTSLTANGIATGAPSLGSPALTQVHALTANGISTGTPSAGSPTITQTHSIAATAISTGAPSLGTPDLAQVHVFTASGIVTGVPTLGTPLLTIAGTLVADNITAGAPSLGSPAITQVHGLLANAIATGAPSLGQPGLTQVHGFTATGIATGEPSLGSPSLSTSSAMVANGIVTGTPSLGSPSLSQVHVLICSPISTGTPTLGQPAISQTHSLIATGVTTGSPTVGVASLNGAMAEISYKSSIWGRVIDRQAIKGRVKQQLLLGRVQK